jgi:hypothetical protein
MLRPYLLRLFASLRETNELVRRAHPTKSFVTLVFFVVQSLHHLLPENPGISQLALHFRDLFLRHLLGLPFRKTLDGKAAHAKHFL